MRRLKNLVYHMRLLRPRWEQRALTFAGMASLTAGMILVPMAPTSARVIGPGAVQGPHSPVTVRGPHLYDPATGKPFPNASTVTAGQVSGLRNQLIHVSWTNFTSSVFNNSPRPFYSNTATDYAVMVTECRGASPASMDDCYLADDHGHRAGQHRYRDQPGELLPGLWPDAPVLAGDRARAGRRARQLRRSQQRPRPVRRRGRARYQHVLPRAGHLRTVLLEPADRDPAVVRSDAERLPAARCRVQRRRVADDGRCHAAVAHWPVRGTARHDDQLRPGAR